MNKKQIASGIVIYSDVISNYNEVLDNIKKTTSEESEIKWNTSRIIKDGKSVVDYSQRKVDVIGIPFKDPKEVTSNNLSNREYFNNELGNLFYNSFKNLIDDYKISYGLNLIGTHLEGIQEPYQLLRYGKGNFFNNHFDDCVQYHRRISIIYYFNDNYIGGEISFKKFDVKYKPKANDLIIFPSSYIYSHSVSEVTEGVRYALVTWIR